MCHAKKSNNKSSKEAKGLKLINFFYLVKKTET